MLSAKDPKGISFNKPYCFLNTEDQFLESVKRQLPSGRTTFDQANVFRCALSPRQSGSQISAPLSIKTSCNPFLCYVSLLFSASNHIYIIIY